MPTTLEGSCHCGTVRFTVESSTPIPYQLCVCSICRKVGGVGGSINIGAHSKTLNITQGKEHIGVYNAVLDRDTPNESWPELLHPFAPAIDSPELEEPDELVIVKANSKPKYVRIPEGAKKVYENYGPYSIENWHKKNGKFVE